MNIQKGLLVKTLSGRVVKVEKQVAPLHWRCDDGHIHQTLALNVINEDQRTLYFSLHRNKFLKDLASDYRKTPIPCLYQLKPLKF